MFKEMILEERQESSQEIFKGKLLHVFRDDIRLPNGEKSTREYIKHIGAVCVVPVNDDNKIIVERQYRYAVNEAIIEIPAGKLDYKGEDPLEACKRELKEETGYVAQNYTYMGKFYPTPSYSDEVIHMYLATGLTQGERDLDEDEFINIEVMPLKDLVKLIVEGKVPDAKTQAAVLKTWAIFNS